jgi:hypothetical protein
MDMKPGHLSLSRLLEGSVNPESFTGFAGGHIGTCPECLEKTNWLNGVLRSVRTELQYEPPDWSVANVIRLYRLRRPRAVRFAEQVVATLIYDSFNDSLPFGMRQRDLPARQTLYQVEDFQLDLRVQVTGDDTGLIVGQIISESPDVSVKGVGIALSHDGKLIGATETNALGEFVFEDLPKAEYELIVQFGERLLQLLKLPLGKQ